MKTLLSLILKPALTGSCRAILLSGKRKPAELRAKALIKRLEKARKRTGR
ncbi:MAG: hypothetical protein ABI333_13965 [bacterium]